MVKSFLGSNHIFTDSDLVHITCSKSLKFSPHAPSALARENIPKERGTSTLDFDAYGDDVHVLGVLSSSLII